MRGYRTDYSNHVHMLLVSISKHLYILKNRTLKYQKKKMDYNLKNFHKADRELVVHYLIPEHISGVFYGEIHSSIKMIPVEEFLYRAWSEKQNFKFCGLPTILSVPKTIESEELLNLVTGLSIKPINPTGGFMGGIKHLKIWEDRVCHMDYKKYYLTKKSLTFKELQQLNIEICMRESKRDLKRGGGVVGKKIELWEQGINDMQFRLPPHEKEFFGFLAC